VLIPCRRRGPRHHLLARQGRSCALPRSAYSEIADRGHILSHGELAASGRAGQLSKDSALLAASYLGGTAGDVTR
jgi:hypothetical protein